MEKIGKCLQNVRQWIISFKSAYLAPGTQLVILAKYFMKFHILMSCIKNITQFPAGQCLGGCQMITLTVFTLILFKSCTWFKLGLNWGEKRTLLKTVFMA